jgi:hypothetical protein
MSKLHLACLILGVCGVAAESHLIATGNPHASSKCPSVHDAEFAAEQESAAATCLKSIDPLSVIATPLPTQSDTHVNTVMVKYRGTPIPLYQFRQPARLSDLQLPFRILPLRAIDLANVVEIAVSAEQAADSWYPGYSWSILVCTGCSGTMHIGWKFTGTQDSFYALIVEYMEDEEIKEGSFVGRVAEKLQIGVPAPAWMLAMLATSMKK